MKAFLFVIKLLLLKTCTNNRVAVGEENKRMSAFINGDFIIGALLPVHMQPNKELITSQGIKCGYIREQYGIQRVEVAFQTLDKINNDPNLLPNLTLGVEIRDECWYAPVALQQSIELIRDAITPQSPDGADSCTSQNLLNTSQTRKGRRGPLIGVVGPGASSVTLQVQNLLQLFHIPQVGYSSTSRDLSDKNRFNYFLRVVPSDYYQAQVILDIVRYFGWTYVSVVNTDENYGQSGMQAFRELSEAANVCIARENSVLSNDPDETFDKVIQNLRQDPQANVVICFCEGFTVKNLLRATKRLNMTNYFMFIGSDGWADRRDVIEGLEEEAWGGLSVRIYSPYVKSFDKYYTSLKPYTNKRNPWFKEFWETNFSCVLPDENNVGNQTETLNEYNYVNSSSVKENKKICTGYEDHREYHQDSKLRFVIKAIYSLAHALHDMQQNICGQGSIGSCNKLTPFNGSLFMSYLLNVSFEYENEIVTFDDKGDPPGRYDILNYQKLNGTYDYVKVGSWNKRNLQWFKDKPLQFANGRTVRSVCSDECPKGYYKNVQIGGKDKRCCWTCVPCSDGYVLPEGKENCQKCLKGYAPNKLKTDCLILPIEYVRWFDTEAIIAIMFATIGFITTIFTFVVFVKYNNTPVVKSSTKELCYIIMIGMAIAHGSIFAILHKPTQISCALVRILPGISFSLIYAALLTKTNRIARILAGNKKKINTKKPVFMSAGAQVVITIGLVFIEVILQCTMFFHELPNFRNNYQNTKTILECDITPVALATPLAYDLFLIILCTIYAIKTRDVPENFNEAKFTGFAMYTTCVIWIAFVPIYFGSDSKVITMCICVTLSASVTLCFHFVPKLYIILLKPEKNNRSFFTTSKSIRCHIGSKVSSALSEKNSINSWKESDCFKECDKFIVSQKRSISCQTGNELLEVLLNPSKLVNSPCKCLQIKNNFLPRIIERDCCMSTNCVVKNITIMLPDNSSSLNI